MWLTIETVEEIQGERGSSLKPMSAAALSFHATVEVAEYTTSSLFEQKQKIQ